MQTVNRQVSDSAGDLASVISITAPATDAHAPSGRVPLVLVKRDGAVTIRDLIDDYIRNYAGRDTTRGQRLAFWSAQLGDVILSARDDDNIAHALGESAATRGRYFTGKDADGARLL